MFGWHRRYYRSLPASYDESMSYLEQVRLLCKSVKELAEVVEQAQEKLISGMNIKTINGQSILGAGDLDVSGEDAGVTSLGGKAGVLTLDSSLKMNDKQLEVDTDVIATVAAVASALAGKQEILTSGGNIKTINGKNVLGSGNLTVGLEVLTGDTPTTSTEGELGQLYQDNNNNLWYCLGVSGASYLWKQVCLATLEISGTTLNITI